MERVQQLMVGFIFLVAGCTFIQLTLAPFGSYRKVEAEMHIRPGLGDPAPAWAKTPTIARPNAPSTKPIELPAGLPDLDPSDVIHTLEARGFSCEDPWQSEDQWKWECTQGDDTETLRVQLISRSPNTVDAINSSAQNSSDARMADFLGFIAALPYDSATPELAQQWAEQSIAEISGTANDVYATTFAGVHYMIYSTGTGITLEMVGGRR